MTETNPAVTPKKRRRPIITEAFIATICDQLHRNLRVRRTLPESGRVHIDRQLPFLCVYRRPTGEEDLGTELLVKGEAAYLVASGASAQAKKVSALVQGLVETLSKEFGAFLLVEIWAARDDGHADDPAVPSVLPTFRIHGPKSESIANVIDVFEQRLERIKVLKQGVHVDTLYDGKCAPPGLPALLPNKQADALNCSRIGIAIPPIYREAASQAVFPQILQVLRRNLSLALRQTYFEFARTCTTQAPRHFHALGRRAVVKAVWDVDRRLAAVGNQFDYLLQLTPVNSKDAWRRFQRNHFEKRPTFHYRPLPVDPSLLKRQLYRIPLNRVEDPALQRLFRQKQEELELQLTMLRDREQPEFIYESLQLFGKVSDDLYRLATEILDARKKKPRSKQPPLPAAQFAESARAEIASYREVAPSFKAGVEVRDDINGLIVSRGKLLIGSDVSIPAARVPALLSHEVGTHLVTYYNGRAQPFNQLYSGLAGYEDLQEGLAVLSEYLVGGFSQDRLRQLAARVVAVRHRIDGASFIETFRVLDRDYGFTQRSAFSITMRVFRGGGLTKDAVYLRGLREILHYVHGGGSLEPLMIGKIALEHIPIIRELQYRKVLKPIPTIPHYLSDPDAIKRLERLRETGSGSVMDLLV